MSWCNWVSMLLNVRLRTLSHISEVGSVCSKSCSLVKRELHITQWSFFRVNLTVFIDNSSFVSRELHPTLGVLLWGGNIH